MARYIDADELDLEYYGLSIHGTIAVKSVLPIFADLLEKQPTADVVEVTRCKNCQHYEADIICEGVGYCNEHQKGMRESNFCSYGEK